MAGKMKTPRKNREYQDFAPWARRIGLIITLAFIIYLLYLAGSLAWRKISSIKHSYKKASDFSLLTNPQNERANLKARYGI